MGEEEKKKNEESADEATDLLLRQSVGYARHIQNFMQAIQTVKEGVIKSADFNKATRIYRVGDYTRIDISLSAEQEEISIPNTVTDEDLVQAEQVGTSAQNFMKALAMVKAGVVLKTTVTDKTIIYRRGDVVTIDILSALL